MTETRGLSAVSFIVVKKVLTPISVLCLLLLLPFLSVHLSVHLFLLFIWLANSCYPILCSSARSKVNEALRVGFINIISSVLHKVKGWY